MLEILETIGEFVVNVGVFVASLFKSYLNFITFCGKIFSTIEGYFPYIPDWLLPYAVLFLSTGVAILIAGRN